MLFVLYLIRFDNIFTCDVCIHYKHKYKNKYKYKQKNMSFCKIFSVNCRAKPPDNVEAISMRLKIEIPYHLDMLNNPEYILCQGKKFTKCRKHFERKVTKDSVCARIERCFVDIRCCCSIQSVRYRCKLFAAKRM